MNASHFLPNFVERRDPWQCPCIAQYHHVCFLFKGTFHPKSLKDLYRSVMTWQRLHFRVCKHVPQQLKDEYWKHKESDQTRGKTTYWVTSAMRLGLKDINEDRDGICYVNPKRNYEPTL